MSICEAIVYLLFQARAAKLSEYSQAAEEEEDQETPSRNLRVRVDRNLKMEEEEEEEEDDDDDDEEEEEVDEGQKSREAEAPILKQFEDEEGEEIPRAKPEKAVEEKPQFITSQENDGLEKGGRVTRSQEEARRSHLARQQQEKDTEVVSPIQEANEVKSSQGLEERSQSPSPPPLTEDLEKTPVVPEQIASEEETPPPLLTKEASSPPTHIQLRDEEEIEPVEGPAPPVLIQLSPRNTDPESRELVMSPHPVHLVRGLSPLSSIPDTKAESPAERVPAESVLPLAQKSSLSEYSAQKGLETEPEKSAHPLPPAVEELAPTKGTTEEPVKKQSSEQKGDRRAPPTLFPDHDLKQSADSSSSRSSSPSSSSSRSRSHSPDSSASHPQSSPRSKQRDGSQARVHANPHDRPKMGSRSTSESRSRSRSRSRSASSSSRKVCGESCLLSLLVLKPRIMCNDF